jgi:hypothetical protein
VSIKPGTRLKSQVDSTEVIIVRAPAADLVLTCGGHPLIDLAAEPAPGLTASGDGEPGQLGKRYTAPDHDDLELLVTKAGSSGLAADDVPLVVKAAKPLPSSD